MKKKSIILLTVIISTVTLSTAALAWGPGGGRGCGKRFAQGARNGMVAQLQNLDEEQQAQINALQQKFIDETAEARTGLISKYEGIRILMETSTPDREKMIALVNEIGDLKKQVMAKRIDFALDAKKIAPELDIPLSFEGRGGCYGMGMGGFRMKGCQNLTTGCPGRMGCQTLAAGCPGQAQTN